MSRWLARALAAPPTFYPSDEIAKIDETPPSPPISSILAHLSQEREVSPAMSLIGPAGAWERAFHGLDCERDPCPGIRRWPDTHRACLRFLSDRADAAAGLGWTAVDIFGVHPAVGAIRVDCCGALMLSFSGAVAEVHADHIRYASGLAYRRRRLPPGQVIPVWEFGL